MFYQVLSRNNDRNGIGYRLIMVYNNDTTVHRIIEFRESFIHGTMSRLYPDAKCIECVHLQPSEYNRLKRRYSDILETL